MMRKMFRLLFWVALIAGILIGFARLTMIRWWRVPNNDPYLTASISPSLRGGDLILLWRLTKPGYGDLAMCPEPNRPDRVVIGRIVGISRDAVEVTGADIKRNAKRVAIESDCTQRTFIEHDPSSGQEVTQSCQMEDLGGKTNMRGELVAESPHPAEVKTTVPMGQVWLLSDNRLFPYDSRDFGPVASDTCTETVFFRLVGAGGFFDTATRNQYIR